MKTKTFAPEHIDYWHKEIKSSVEGNYARMDGAESDECLEELAVLDEIVALAKKRLGVS